MIFVKSYHSFFSVCVCNFYIQLYMNVISFHWTTHFSVFHNSWKFYFQTELYLDETYIFFNTPSSFPHFRNKPYTIKIQENNMFFKRKCNKLIEQTMIESIKRQLFAWNDNICTIFHSNNTRTFFVGFSSKHNYNNTHISLH